jgi:hypothetical protein
MNENEKLLVKKLGYIAFVLYTYAKHHPEFHNKDMQWELGLSKESTQRYLQKLKQANVIIIHGHCHTRIFEIVKEKNWTL